ncbi:MAG: alpha-2-macroglobulin [Planctomycetaceae bacterium]|nr:alpha-2-macroglobulin [Planctomycetaceae bacterium]
MFQRIVTLALAVSCSLGVFMLMAADAPLPDLRSSAKKEYDAGNWRDAYEKYQELCLDERNEGQTLASDYQQAVQSLNNLQQQGEIDGFRESVLGVHSNDWRLLVAAAQSYQNGPNYGFIVGGEFVRGSQRGGGRYVMSLERDRVRALQLMDQARVLIHKSNASAADRSFFFRQLANTVYWQRSGNDAWRLQDLTDLNDLPDYEEGNRFRGFGGPGGKGAPVDADGNPVLHAIPESWDSATSDGQRWRWCFEQVVKYQPSQRSTVDFEFAGFLRSQFGVQTMQQWGIVLPRYGDDGARGRADDEDESGPYAVHTLSDDETIARLATGVKRFTLPDEFNFIRIYQQLTQDESGFADPSLQQLAQIYEDRQQYPKAAQQWQESIRRFRDRNRHKRQRLEQIVGNWGRFEGIEVQPARTGAAIDFRFRNGNQVSFTARHIKVAELIDDVKTYLKSNPQQVDWQQTQIDNLGYRLVQQNERKYVGEQVAQWDVELEPRPEHFDRRVTITTPLQQAGAYLVTGKMADGNTSRVIIWVADTAIAKKPLDGKAMYYVADAVTGQPIAGANVEFFGWRQESVPGGKGRNQYRVITSNFAEKTNDDGQVITDPKLMEQNLQWIAIARTPEGRFAHLGFSGIWYGHHHREEYDQTKGIVITDRPVYRPEQTVQFKLWIREAKYDQTEESRFAHQKFKVIINDPEGTEVYSETLTTDEYGGMVGHLELPEDAKLGTYQIALDNPHGIWANGNFRVEEYKKPEFEVTIDAPDKPVALGDTIKATITAKYYFGAPVTNATVRYKVERSVHEARWYPYRPWDWLYGEGYWWFTPDSTWYPGFKRWGCFAPIPSWWNWNPDPPELVLDREVEIGEDGTVEVEIDTSLAKALHGDEDHSYKITAEVVDASRRTIVGQGNVLVAREPFKVFVWTHRGHYRVGDTIHANFQARTLDGKGVEGSGTLKLLRITYDDKGEPVENVAQEWELDTDADGTAEIDIKATDAGQYRLSYALQAHGLQPVGEGDEENASTTIEGGQLFVIRGEGFDGSEFKFNDLELIVDKPEYAPDDTVNLLINTNRIGSTVLLFVRPTNGVYVEEPRVLRMDGKSTVVDIGVVQGDMPNFFVEGLTIADGKVYSVVKEIVVPPEQRVLNVSVEPDHEDYQPGQEANVTLKLTDLEGQPFVGSMAMSVYDRAVEYISGGSNVPEIREFFWKWRRNHNPNTEHSLARWSDNLLKQGETPMGNLGVFGEQVADNEFKDRGGVAQKSGMRALGRGMEMRSLEAMPAMAAPMSEMAADGIVANTAQGGEAGAMVESTVRTQFADTAFWKGDITTDSDGLAKVSLTMPENLTGWKIRTWAMGHGTRVGEGETVVTTSKNLLVRLQAPRFFTETDEVVLSAIVHNYLETEKQAQVELILEGGTLEPMASGGRQSSDGATHDRGLTPSARHVTIPAGGEVRVDWRVKAVAEGDAVVTVKALTDEESDAMQQTFPVYVHGILKTESFSGVIRPKDNTGVIDVTVPADRRPEQTRLEVRYSPTLAGAMVDALPYLVEYPYGCTEQTLNRFLPTVITQRILQRMGLDLAAIQEKRTNLNAQEIGDAGERAAQWKQYDRNPVFDEAEVERMVKQGVKDLTAMQLSDGGWGWFSGFGEQSYPHTTAVVVHGLQIATQNDVALVPGVLDRGIEWLKQYQDQQVSLLQEGERRAKLEGERLRKHKKPYRMQASNIDALVFMALVDADQTNDEMQRFLFRDRLELSLYAQALFGLALHEIDAIDQRDTIIRNIDQFLKVDDENQTAYLDLPNQGYWWNWFGDTIEGNAFYLKLLTRVNPQDEKAAGLVKYLLNNRKHATYWNSTRDTAYCIEAMAEYLTASGEDKPDMTIEVIVDGKVRKEVQVTSDNLFTFENSLVLEGEAVESGPHQIELRKRGTGPLYYNAYLTNFTTEDFITSAGLEIKVEREFYKLVQREDATDVVQGSQGQVIDQQALKYDRVPLANLSEVTSGDLIEIELTIESKNDYEYVVFEDRKAAGCEPVELQSGYTKDGLGAYVEFRDEKVAFFLRRLARGTHSVSYRLRSEIPGQYSALPTKAYAMYAPELRANSDELKLQITD